MDDFGIFEAMTIVSFFITIANYSENLDQSSAQDLINSAVNDIHKHLKDQDEKIDSILNILYSINKSEMEELNV